MKSSFSTLFAVALSSGMLFAQEPVEIDIEARKASIPLLESHIKDREARMATIKKDMIEIDQRLEAQIKKVVDYLASIKDSKSSGYRVSQVKMDAMKGLKRTVDNYQSKRATLIQQLREGQNQIPKEVLEKDAEVFDERIAKRVDQIMEISKSFTKDADVEKYETDSGGGYYNNNGWGNRETTRISDDYRQNRRDRTMDGKQRKQMIGALKKSIERYESIIAGHKDSLANRKMSESEAELMNSEMERDARILAERQSQLSELHRVPTPGTSPVQRSAATDLQAAIRDAAGDMRNDFDDIFVKYAQLNRERSKVFALKKSLAAREKWIVDYEAKNP
jgi:hypothetical protein